MRTGSYDKCGTTFQDISVPFAPQVGYKETTLPCFDLQSFFNVISASFQREDGVKMVVSSFKCPFWERDEDKKGEAELLKNLEFSYRKKCAWKAIFQSQELHSIQQFFQSYRIYRYISFTVTFCRLQTPPNYQAVFPTINEGVVKYLKQSTVIPSNTACRGAHTSAYFSMGVRANFVSYMKLKDYYLLGPRKQHSSLLPSELGHYSK